MLQRESARQLFKQALWWTRVKLIYTRITLTKFTTFYFFLALFGCIVQVILQGVAFADNSEAASIVSNLLSTGNITKGLAILMDGQLQMCSNIPGQDNANCTAIVATSPIQERSVSVFDHVFARSADDKPRPHINSKGLIDGVKVGQDTLDTPCLQSLLWLADILRDARREDIITLAFQIWLFSLAIVTILNESLPHLGAALLAHVLGTAWAGFRVSNSKHLQTLYQQLVVKGTCHNVDLLGPWWDIRTQHTIPVVVLNAVALLVICYLSTKLFKVYAAQSFSRVGASPEIHKIYKLVLLLSVCLQLAGFFTLGATGMWIDKVSSGTIRGVARHLTVYIAAFAVIAALELPWVTFGWLCVRKESRWMFRVFCGISALLFVVSTVLFASPLYRFVFHCWPFFATMTVTAYILIVVTSVSGVLCSFNFGKGLAQYLKVTEVLEGVDFTPVYFTTDPSVKPRDSSMDLEKGLDSKPTVVRIEALPYGEDRKQYSDLEKGIAKISTTPPVVWDDSPLGQAVQEQMPSPPPASLNKSSAARENIRSKVVSVYSDNTRQTVKISSTPELFRDESPLGGALAFEPSAPVETFRSSSLRSTRNLTERTFPPGLTVDIQGTISKPSPTRSASSASKTSPTRSPGSMRGKGLPSNPRPSHNTSKSTLTEPSGNYF